MIEMDLTNPKKTSAMAFSDARPLRLFGRQERTAAETYMHDRKGIIPRVRTNCQIKFGARSFREIDRPKTRLYPTVRRVPKTPK